MRGMVMSRIGKRPVKIEEGVNVVIDGSFVIAKSNLGENKYKLPAGITVEIKDNNLFIGKNKDNKIMRALHGTSARIINNLISDAKSGYKKVLDFKGTGYRARVENNNIILNMGYSHEIILQIPTGLTVSVVKNKIVVEGINREIAGQFAANVREVRLPEVYKGKGIKYETETIKKKAGKAAQATTGK